MRRKLYALAAMMLSAMVVLVPAALGATVYQAGNSTTNVWHSTSGFAPRAGHEFFRFSPGCLDGSQYFQWQYSNASGTWLAPVFAAGGAEGCYNDRQAGGTYYAVFSQGGTSYGKVRCRILDVDSSEVLYTGCIATP